MATLTPNAPSVTATAMTPITPTATDTIPCSAYRFVVLVIRTGGTNTYTGTVDDPNTQAPANMTAFNPDATTGTVPISSIRTMRLDCARFRDTSGNITITSASTFAGTTLEAIGID
jgi:polyisoprenoid-binding protein YceI